MQRNGFSLVELITVIAIMAILLSLATLQFNRYSTKAAIEAQAKAMYADLMTVRSQALFEKRNRAVKLSATGFDIYSSGSATGTPSVRKTLKYGVVFDALPDPVVFNSRGIIEGIDSASICIEPSDNAGAVDSLILSTTRIQTGKRNAATLCKTENIQAK